MLAQEKYKDKKAWVKKFSVYDTIVVEGDVCWVDFDFDIDTPHTKVAGDETRSAL